MCSTCGSFLGSPSVRAHFWGCPQSRTEPWGKLCWVLGTTMAAARRSSGCHCSQVTSAAPWAGSAFPGPGAWDGAQGAEGSPGTRAGAAGTARTASSAAAPGAAFPPHPISSPLSLSFFHFIASIISGHWFHFDLWKLWRRSEKIYVDIGRNRKKERIREKPSLCSPQLLSCWSKSPHRY